MKKVLIIMMSVLLIGALFISCSQQVQEDRLGSVDISFQESRTLDVTVTSDIKPVSDLVWYYTAIKTSGLYATGQKTTLTKIGAGLVSGTKLDDFSTGGWKFSFYGFNTEPESSDTENAVYYAKDIEITVVAEQSNPVNIALSVGKIGKGKVVFTGLSVDLSSMILRTGGTLTLNIKQDDVQKATFTSGEVTGPASYSLKSGEETTVTLDGIDPGTYTYIFSVVYTLGNESVEVAEEEWQVTVNNGTVVTFEGDVLKTNELADVVIGEVTGETEAEAVIEPTSLSEAKSYTVEISPASVSNPDSVARTTVSFPESVLNSVITADGGQTLTSSKVTIDVTDTVEASTKFIVVGESSSAFAGINLDLYKTVTTTATEESTTSKIVNPSFATPVTVETYIAKGLTGVTVEYQANEGDEYTSHPAASTDPDKIAEKQADVYATDAAMGEKLGYSQQSGLLRFTTTHFSEFAVGADQNVYDKTTNTAYKLSEREDETKGLLLDAAGKKVTANINDEYVLLDSSLANSVDVSIDNFNAGYTWTAIHSETEPDYGKQYFKGGWGTRIEPYLIADFDQWNSFYQVVYDWEGDEKPYFKLTDDINCEGKTIKNYAYNEAGNKDVDLVMRFALNGDGHTVRKIEGLAGYGQLFVDIRDASIMNITIDYNLDQARTIAMALNSSGSCEFINVNTTGRMKTSANWASAFVVYPFDTSDNGLVKYINCKNYADLTTNYTSSSYVAPFGSHTMSIKSVVLENCENHGTIAGGSASAFVGMTGGNSSRYTVSGLKNYGKIYYSVSGNLFTYENHTLNNNVVAEEGSSIEKTPTVSLEISDDNHLVIKGASAAYDYRVSMSVPVQMYGYNGNNSWSGAFPRKLTKTYSQISGDYKTDFMKVDVLEMHGTRYDYSGEQVVPYYGIFAAEDMSSATTIISNLDEEISLVSYNNLIFYYFNETYESGKLYHSLVTTANGAETGNFNGNITVTLSVEALLNGDVVSSGEYKYSFSVAEASHIFN